MLLSSSSDPLLNSKISHLRLSLPVVCKAHIIYNKAKKKKREINAERERQTKRGR